MGYRIIRSTVVLAMHSRAIDEIRSDKLDEVLARVEGVNFDLARLDDRDLELLYAHFDDAFGERVKGEFEFLARPEDVLVHDTCEAVCVLCGKGGSKDTGDNRDHIRFEFRLSNHAGGKDVWCGSTCIINYGLKVRGAQTSDEARELLEKSMRSALRLWTIRQWQNEHPDHHEIPNQYREMCRLRTSWWGRVPARILGLIPVFERVDSARHGLKLASRHYQRHVYLPPKKTADWLAAKSCLRAAREGNEVLSAMANLPLRAQLDFLVEAAKLIHPK